MKLKIVNVVATADLDLQLSAIAGAFEGFKVASVDEPGVMQVLSESA